MYTMYKKPGLLAEAIYINSAHYRLIGRDEITKDDWLVVSFSGTLFKFQITSEKHVFLIKIKEIIS